MTLLGQPVQQFLTVGGNGFVSHHVGEVLDAVQLESGLVQALCHIVLQLLGHPNDSLDTAFSGNELLGADEVTFDMTTTYLRWILIFAPAFMLNEVLHCFVRNDDAPNLVMFATLAGSFANIVFDYIFIFPMNMGILGAVLATGSAPIFSILIMLPHWLKKKNTFHFVLKGLVLADFKAVSNSS